MNTFYWVSNYVLEFLKLNIFVFGIFNCPYKGNKIQWIPSVAAIWLIGILSFLAVPEDGVILVVFILLIINVGLMLVRKKDIFLVMFAIIFLSIIEIILDGTFRMIVPVKLFSIMDRNMSDFLFNVLTGVCLLVIDAFLHKNKDIFQFSIKNITYIFMGLLAMALYLYPIQYSYSQLKGDSSKLIYSMLGISISSIIFLIVCFINLKSVHEREIYKEKSKSYKEYVKKQEAYYKELLQKEKSTRQFRHDMLNHISCLQIYLEEGEINRAKEYLREMAGTTQSLSKKIITGHNTIDIVAADVFGAEKEITLRWMGKFPQHTNISDMDLCSLFSNLLKNALEATKNYEGDGKEVIVQIKKYSSSYFILVKNPCKNKPEKMENKFITSKNDKENHGFGMLNIEQIIKKYNGTIQYEYKNNFFMIRIGLENISIEES